MPALQDVVTEERHSHPLDELTRRLLSLLQTQADGLGALYECMELAHGDAELYLLLARMHQQQALWIQHLEPQVRRRLHRYSPTTPVEPW